MTILQQLSDLFQRLGASQEVALFIRRHQIYSGQLGPLLEETFRRIDLGPRDVVCRRGACVSPEVEFLLRNGAGFNWQNHKLLEDTYRCIELGPWENKRRAGVCFSPEVNILLHSFLLFEEVPCGLDQLARDTANYIRQSDENTEKYFRQRNQLREDEICKWQSLLDAVDVELRLCVPENINVYFNAVEAISGRESIIKIYNEQKVKQDGVRWPLVAYGEDYTPKSGYIVELLERSPKVNLVAKDGHSITVSKMLLRARSPYFKDLIGHDPTEISYDIRESYQTIRWVVEYMQTEPNDVSWSHFKPCGDRDSTEDILDELICILYSADKFQMVDLHGRTQRQIIEHGDGFIYGENVEEIKQIAEEANASFLERYCKAFLELNRSFTCFLGLSMELQLAIWHYAVFQPQVVSAPTLWKPDNPTTSHIAGLLGACKVSSGIAREQFKKNSKRSRENGQITYFNSSADIAYIPPNWVKTMGKGLGVAEVKGAQYCAFLSPPCFWSGEQNLLWDFISELVYYCQGLKILYLTAEVLTDDDIFEYCRSFTNREPANLVGAQNMIEERVHEHIKGWLTEERILPKIVMVGRIEWGRRFSFKRREQEGIWSNSAFSTYVF